MKIMCEKILKIYVYICPKCFNKPADCTCPILPLSLIQIDKNIWPTIKVLNEKRHFTESCCEGHIGANEMIYILFKKKQKINVPLPKGFEGNLYGLKANITGNSDEAKKRKKRKLLNDLYNWACSLESRKPKDWDW